MKFDFECDVPDGLVLIDEYYFNDFNSDILYSFEVLLDSKGRTELVHDFPNEKWETVRERETVAIKEFCNLGKMIVFLSDKDINDCEIKCTDSICDTNKYINIKSGNIIVINACELIQCLAYPDLEMDILGKIEVEKGWYAIDSEGGKNILYCPKTPLKASYDNIQEL